MIGAGRMGNHLSATERNSEKNRRLARNASVGIHAACTVALAIAVGCPFWFYQEGVTFGLWQDCIKSTCYNLGNDVEGTMRAARAFLVLSLFVAGLLAPLAFVLTIRQTHHHARHALCIILLFAGVSAAVGICILGSKYGKDGSIRWCLPMAGLAATITIINGIGARKIGMVPNSPGKVGPRGDVRTAQQPPSYSQTVAPGRHMMHPAQHQLYPALPSVTDPYDDRAGFNSKGGVAGGLAPGYGGNQMGVPPGYSAEPPPPYQQHVLNARY